MTYPTVEVATKKIAERIKHEVDSNEAYYIALTGGLQAPLLYRALAEEDIAWEKVHIFFACEILSGPQKGFNYQLAKHHLFDKAPIHPGNIHPISVEGNESDLQTVKDAYIDEVSALVPTIGGHHRFNMVLLEMSEDGGAAGFYRGDEELYSEKDPYLQKNRPQDNENLLTISCEALGTAKSLLFYAFGDSLRFMLGNIINLMPEAKLYPANYLLALYPWAYIYADSQAMREKSYAIY